MDVVVNGFKEDLPPYSNSLMGFEEYYQNILLCLGYESQYLPLAGLLKLYHQLSGQWLVATPIRWEATHNDAMLVAGAKKLGLSEQESRLWFDEVADFLKEDGFEPFYHDAHTWLFKHEDKPELRSQSIHSLLHQSLMPVLDEMDNTHFWQRLITELQMFLSTHPLNMNRQSDLAINGLWFWGERELCLNEKKVLYTDDEKLFDCLNRIGLRPEILSLKSDFENDQLVVIHKPSQIDLAKLEEKFKKFQVNWYWNNCSFSNQARSWWLKLWKR